MKYNYKSIPLIKIPHKIKEPLCNSCVSCDCDNPVEKIDVSFPTGKKKWRLMVWGNDISIVVFCQGYQGDEESFPQGEQ